MSTPSAVRSVRQALRETRKVLSGSGHTLQSLTDDMGGEYLHDEIADAVNYMERHGEVEIERTNKVVTGLRYRGLPQHSATSIARAKTPRIRHATAPPFTVERTFARDIPDDLVDMPCSPVSVRRKEWPVKPLSGFGVITPANLTSALNALRNACDKDRVLQAVGAVSVIQEAMGCSSNQAQYLNLILGKLGVRVSENLGKGRSKTTVQLTPDEVTEDMLQTARHAGKLDAKPRKPRQKAVTPSSDVRPQITDEAPTPDQVFERLTVIIESLEAQIALQREAIGDLTAERDALQSENARLKDQVHSGNIVGAKLAQVLQRYPESQK